MGLFKRKKEKQQIPENTKFKMRETVHFRYNGELRIGVITKIYLANDDQRVLYTIMIGGECPAIIDAVEENTIVSKK